MPSGFFGVSAVGSQSKPSESSGERVHYELTVQQHTRFEGLSASNCLPPLLEPDGLAGGPEFSMPEVPPAGALGERAKFPK